jgi:HTH-type transcriptional regulator/antitoxin HigA
MTLVTNKPTKQYRDLIEQFALRPIRSKAQQEAATLIMDRLAVRSDLSRDEADYLDVLSDLVDAYDRAHNSLQDFDATGLEVLRELMEQHQMKQSALAKKMEISEAAVSMILAGDRAITADHARSLGRIFSANPGLFL